ncbi:hypothetical protein SAMD00019534_095620, partial [Acytostelium subglobosum LB1]|uniref:hypothetical protein n=1 Tax=Acytostelium subglobosum LB1 TaxID=1410327 RepID=UPI000644B443
LLISSLTLSIDYNILLNIVLTMIQLGINYCYSKTVGVYRQVPASFNEMFSILSIYHIMYIAVIFTSQPFLLYSLLSLRTNSFSLWPRLVINCVDLPNGNGIAQCEVYSNPFFYCFLIVSLSIIGAILYRTYSYSEYILSFPKLQQHSLKQQVKSAIYSNFWTAFYTSFYLAIATFFYGIILLIENNNVFLLQGLGSSDPLVQHHAWRDFLHLSQYSEGRRSYLFNEMKQMAESPSIIKIVQEYERMMTDVINKLQCPPEHYQQQQQQQQNQKEATDITTTLLHGLHKLLGISVEFDIYECEIRQCMSNTQPIVWAIEALSAFVMSSLDTSNRESREHVNLIHQYHILQRFLSPLVELMAILDRLELKNTSTTTLTESSVIPDTIFLRRLLGTSEIPPTCIGILSTVRPHFRLLKYVGKNIISHLLNSFGNQLSDSSFPYQYRLLLKEYRQSNTMVFGGN